MSDAYFASSKSVEWYTPRHIVERVKSALRAIDLDPCSNSRESPNVPAGAHFTVEDDGLSKPWSGKVFCNPPYGRTIGAWIHKALDEYTCGLCSELILLVPANTETRWFQRIWEADALCFPKGRLTFCNAAGVPQKGNTAGSALAYFGPYPDAFAGSFRDLGHIIYGP